MGTHMYQRYTSGDINYPSHGYGTRSGNIAVPTYQRLSQTQRSLTYSGPKMWNSIPDYIKNSHSLKVFKTKYKNYLLSSYNS